MPFDTCTLVIYSLYTLTHIFTLVVGMMTVVCCFKAQALSKSPETTTRPDGGEDMVEPF